MSLDWVNEQISRDYETSSFIALESDMKNIFFLKDKIFRNLFERKYWDVRKVRSMFIIIFYWIMKCSNEYYTLLNTKKKIKEKRPKLINKTDT